MSKGDLWFFAILLAIALANLMLGSVIIFVAGPLDYLGRFWDSKLAWYEQMALVNLCLGTGGLIFLWLLWDMEIKPRRISANNSTKSG